MLAAPELVRRYVAAADRDGGSGFEMFGRPLRRLIFTSAV